LNRPHARPHGSGLPPFDQDGLPLAPLSKTAAVDRRIYKRAGKLLFRFFFA
jgi:hypothetical protein